MEKNTPHIVPYELIFKSLSGDISPGEKKDLELWLSKDQINKGIYSDFEKTWNAMGHVSDVAEINIEEEWKIQQKHISPTESSSFPIERNQKAHSRWDFLKIAAIITFIVLSSVTIYFILPNFTQEKIAATDEIRTVVLADGSRVTLNANSRIKYPSRFKKDSRNISLEGEAFFEVEPIPDAPFIIQTSEALIEVLGTSFNVIEKTQNNETEVTVVEGIVALAGKKHPDNKIILEKGNKGLFNSNNNYLVKQENMNRNFIAWKTRQITFDNDNLVHVISVLENVYHREIIIKDNSLKNCRLTASFENQSIESVFKVIMTTLNINVKEENATFLISGDGC